MDVDGHRVFDTQVFGDYAGTYETAMMAPPTQMIVTRSASQDELPEALAPTAAGTPGPAAFLGTDPTGPA